MPYVTEENLTDVVLERWNDIPDSRLRQIMQSLIQHLHGFVRDIEPTQAEWATAIDWLTRTGQMCSQKRQEFTAPGYHGCITHLFQKGDKFVETDVVYGVKEPLIVEFVKKPPGKSPTGEIVSMPFYAIKYDFVLQKQAATQASLDS